MRGSRAQTLKAQRAQLRCSSSLGDFNSYQQRWNEQQQGSNDPIDQEWETLRQKYNIPDLSVPSTSGRDHVAPYSSMSTHCGFDETWDLADDGYTPFPANLPTNESFDSYGRQAFGALHLSESQDLWSRIGQVYVILFGVGKSETEGIYSLRAMSRADGTPKDTIVAFEDLEDAQRYSTALEATGITHTPHCIPIDPTELQDFCVDSGYNVRLERSGTFFTPPSFNVHMTDWERAARLREGQYSVLEHDPVMDPSKLDDGSQSPTSTMDFDTPFYFGEQLNNAGSYNPNFELDELRARLERLLPE